MKRFLRWLLRNDPKPLHDVSERVWTGYSTMIVTERVASVWANGEVKVTLTLVKPQSLGYSK